MQRPARCVGELGGVGDVGVGQRLGHLVEDLLGAPVGRALGVLAIALVANGRGSEGLARLAFLPAAPAEVPPEDTGTLAMRGMARNLAEDLAEAIADLSAAAARLRAGVPLRSPSLCLAHLALAGYRLGSWDDAVVHAELAVSLARDADRAWEFAVVHCVAAVVPALHGEWEAAGAHVAMAPRPPGPPAPRGRSARPPPPRRSWPWPAAIWRV